MSEGCLMPNGNIRVDARNLTDTSKAFVFISYSSIEFDTANFICQYLEKNSISCWIAPRDIDPGENYAAQTVHAIRNCGVFVLLASGNTNKSSHVSSEVCLAFDSNKTIIPVKLEAVSFSDEYMYYLGRKHWIDAYLDLLGSLPKLLITIQRIIQ